MKQVGTDEVVPDDPSRVTVLTRFLALWWERRHGAGGFIDKGFTDIVAAPFNGFPYSELYRPSLALAEPASLHSQNHYSVSLPVHCLVGDLASEKQVHANRCALFAHCLLMGWCDWLCGVLGAPLHVPRPIQVIGRNCVSVDQFVA